MPDFEALERRREEFSRLAEEHKGDPEAIVEALRELQQDRRGARITPRLAPRLWKEALRLCYECAVYCPILGPSRRGLHDRIAGTLVVSKRRSLGPP